MIFRISLILILMASTTAHALTVRYGWEDGGTVLGSYSPNSQYAPTTANVGAPEPVFGGDRSLKISVPETGDPNKDQVQSSLLHKRAALDNTISSDEYLQNKYSQLWLTNMPYVELATITGLHTGDTISASFRRFDTTPAGYPNLELRPYITTGDGKQLLSTSSGFGEGLGWDMAEGSWTFNGAEGAELVIAARIFAAPGQTLWIDDLSVTTPDYATINIPSAPVPEPSSICLIGLGGVCLALLRARKFRIS